MCVYKKLGHSSQYTEKERDGGSVCKPLACNREEVGEVIAQWHRDGL